MIFQLAEGFAPGFRFHFQGIHAGIADPGIIVAAHIGGYRIWQHTLNGLPPSENHSCDTASTSPYASPELLKALLARFPRERLLFGTDWPLYSPDKEIRRFQEKSGLSDSRMADLMGNALHLFA